jgi:hypothetical protein
MLTSNQVSELRGAWRHLIVGLIVWAFSGLRAGKKIATITRPGCLK